MNTRKLFAYSAVIIIIAAGGAAGFLLVNSFFFQKPLVSPSDEPAGAEQVRTGTGSAAAFLYFAERNKPFLTAEARTVLFSDDASEYGRNIIEELIKGPVGDSLTTIPEGTAVRALYVTENGTAYVDFSAEIKNNHPGGGTAELMTVYSVINSLVLNIPRIKSVKLLIGGEEVETLAGHMDIRSPLKANMLIVR